MKNILKIFFLLTLSVNSFAQLTGGGSGGGATATIYTQGQIVGIADNLGTADRSGGFLVYCDGRLKSSFPVGVQAVFTSLGYGTNIPDLRGRIPVGANGSTYVVNTPGGISSFNLSQNQLPNVAPTASADAQGSHAHGLTGRNYNSTGSPASPFNARGLDGTAVFNSSTTVSTDAAGSHSHNITINSINGGVAQQPIPLRPADYPTNYFIWVGPSQPAVTVTQALSLTTTGTGAVTFNNVTGALNAPTNITIGDAKSGFQTADHNGWVLLNGRAITTLTTTQQAALLTLPAALSLGGNLVNATGRVFVQGTIGALVGSDLLVLTNLPNVSLTTAPGGNHTHQYLAANGSATLGVGSGSRLAGEISISQNTGTTTGTGAHTHTTALNGGVTQTSYTPAGVGVNQFIYLGI
jgi:hypothetical protein